MKHERHSNVISIVEMSTLGLRSHVDISTLGHHIWMSHLQVCIICMLRALKWKLEA